MILTTFKDGRIHLRNSGMKGFKCISCNTYPRIVKYEQNVRALAHMWEVRFLTLRFILSVNLGTSRAPSGAVAVEPMDYPLALESQTLNK